MTDVVSFGPGKPPWRPERRLLLAGVAVLAAAAATGLVVSSRDGSGRAPAAVATGSPSVAPCRPLPAGPAAVRPVAIAVEGACVRGTGLDRRDPAAASGPWAVVVRRPGGSLGRGGAVVTFPVAAGERGSAGSYVWPLAGAHARVRGDLAGSQLRAIAAGTTVRGGRPQVRPPAGYRVVSAGSYRAPSVHEIRYGTRSLGLQAALGDGLTFTGVVAASGFEDALFAAPGGDAEPVGGRPAVVTSVFGGNGALAWETAPGLIAYVGYSGAQLDGTAVAALGSLADAAVGLSDAQWRDLGAQVVEQHNGPG